MLVLDTLEVAEAFVNHQKALGAQVFWDNYDIICFTPAPRAEASRFGAYHNNSWGFRSRYEVNDNGEWHIDRRDVKLAG